MDSYLLTSNNGHLRESKWDKELNRVKKKSHNNDLLNW